MKDAVDRIAQLFSEGLVEAGMGTSSSKIISDIKNYFENGVVPEVNNSLNEFLFSERNTDYAKEVEAVNEELKREGEKLNAEITDLKELLDIQGKETHGKMMKKSSLEAVSKKIMRKLNVDGNVAEFADLIKDVYSYIINGEDVNFETIKEKAAPAISYIENNQKIIKGELSEQAQQIFDHLKGTRVYISPEIRSELNYQNGKGGYNGIRKNLMGWVTHSHIGILR